MRPGTFLYPVEDLPLDLDEPPSAPDGMKAVSARDFLLEQDIATDWLVDGFLPRVGLVVIAGDPKSFKSMLALQVAAAVGGSTYTLDRETSHGPVLFVEEEGSRHKLRDRLLAMMGGFGLSEPPEIAFLLHEGVRLDDADSFAALEATIAAVGPVLVVFDPLAAIHRAGENRSDEMARVLRPLARLAARYRFLAVVIHHTNKPQADRKATRLAQRIRGASELAAATDANVVMDRTGETVQVRAEYRDAEAVELWLRFDADRFLLVPESAPAKRGPMTKVSDDDVIAYIAKVGNGVTVNGTAANFSIGRDTAWRTLFRLADAGLVEQVDEKGAHRFYPILKASA